MHKPVLTGQALRPCGCRVRRLARLAEDVYEEYIDRLEEVRIILEDSRKE